MLRRSAHTIVALRLQLVRFLNSATPRNAYFWGEQYLRPVDKSVSTPVSQPIPVAFLAGRPVTSIATGWGHSVFVTSAGTAVLSGRPLDFRNTLRHINMQAFIPGVQRLVDLISARVFSSDLQPSQHAAAPGDPFVSAFSGPASLTALITASGSLYTMGQNFHGQGGIGSANPGILYEPQRVLGFDPDDARVVDVAIGFEHVLAVTAGGALYSWGRGDRGQCGHGDEESYAKAVRVVGPREAFLGLRVVAVAAGPSSSSCVTADGRAWTWGKMASLQRRGERGDGWIMADQILPRAVGWGEAPAPTGFSPDPAAAAAAPTHVDTQPGRLALDVPVSISDTNFDRRVIALTSGQGHTCLLTADGRIWLVGMRGRGVQYDDSDDIVAALAAAPSDAALQSNAFFPVASAVSETRSAVAPAPLDAVAELHMQTAPLLVPPGPLAGKRIVRLKSSLHHSYAVTACGRVFRLGWRRRVLEMPELAPFFVHDVAFGFRHALMIGSPRECSASDELGSPT